ncbi:MAG: hypothetical protein LBR68_04945 [Lachnoclostridium sp.]|nr:hypothetical protein [Lachnoclostridium sp.]
MLLHTKIYYSAVNNILEPAKGSKKKVATALKVMALTLKAASMKTP